MKNFHYTIAVLILLIAAPIYPANELGNPFIRNYSPAEYLSSSTCWAVVQDRRGVMMIGNANGVIEFDGNHFTITPVTNSSAVRSLACADDGTIYVGAIGELGYLTLDAQGKRRYVSLKNKIKPNHSKFNDVWDCLITSHGVYYITADKAFFWNQQRMEVIPGHFHGVGSMVSHDRLFVMLNTPNGEKLGEIIGNRLQLFAGTGLFSLDTVGGRGILAYMEKNKLLVVTQNKGLLLCDLDTPDGKVKLEPYPCEIADYLKKKTFYRCRTIAPGLFALATQKGGFAIVNDLGKLVFIIDKNSGLADDFVTALFLDREQNLWAALTFGFAHILIHSPVTCFNQMNGLNGIQLSVIRHQGRLYAGNYNGIFLLTENSADGRPQFIQVENAEGNCFNFISIGHILLGGGTKGYYQIIGKKAYFLQGGRNCYSFGYSRKFPRHVFIGTNEELMAMEILADSPQNKHSPPETQQPVRVNLINTGGFENTKEAILKITCDENGDIWASTWYNGILHLKFRNESVSDFEIIRYTAENGLPSALNNIFIHYFDHHIIASTAYGFYRLIPNPDRIEGPQEYRFVPDLDLKHPFSNLTVGISQFCPDNNGRIWTQTGLGFGVFSKNNRGLYQFDNIPFKFIKGSIERSIAEENDIAWLCGVESRALFRFNTSMKKNYKSDYLSLIRQVIAGQNTILFSGNYYNPLSQQDDFFNRYSLRQPDALKPRLPYALNSLAFYYASVYFEHGDENRFSHFLDGFDKEWSVWNKESKAVYTNIPEGSYTFCVKAKNIWEHESQTAFYQFRITPPWHRTWWAFSGYFLVLILFLYGGIRLNSRRLIAAKEKLEEIVAERTAEVVRQKTEIESYAGELFNTNRQLTDAKNALWSEMELAKKIQTVLLPEQPKIPGYEIAAYMKPADEVGGDYYDVINVVGNGRDRSLHWVVIGDVSGHGVPAGLVMMMVQTSIHTALQEHSDSLPDKILWTVNKVIHENIKKFGDEKYMTITLMSVQEDGTVCFSGLHQDIMIARVGKKEVELVETQGMWIGIIENIEGMLKTDRLVLNEGDTMLLFTDGAVEASDAQDQMFSTEQLGRIFGELASRPVNEIRHGILEALAAYKCKDDVTLLIVKRNKSHW